MWRLVLGDRQLVRQGQFDIISKLLEDDVRVLWGHAVCASPAYRNRIRYGRYGSGHGQHQYGSKHGRPLTLCQPVAFVAEIQPSRIHLL